MSQSASTNQVPTSATNQQDATPAASTSPNYGMYQPATVPAATPQGGGGMAPSTPQGGGGMAPSTPQGGGGMYTPPAASTPVPNPFSTQPAAQPVSQPAVLPVANPFSTAPAGPNPQLPTGAGWNQGTQAPNTLGAGGTLLPTASGDFTTNYLNRPGVWTNAQGYTSQASNAANKTAIDELAQAVGNGYKSNGDPALSQYANFASYLKPAPNPFSY